VSRCKAACSTESGLGEEPTPLPIVPGDFHVHSWQRPKGIPLLSCSILTRPERSYARPSVGPETRHRGFPPNRKQFSIWTGSGLEADEILTSASSVDKDSGNSLCRSDRGVSSARCSQSFRISLKHGHQPSVGRPEKTIRLVQHLLEVIPRGGVLARAHRRQGSVNFVEKPFLGGRAKSSLKGATCYSAAEATPFMGVVVGHDEGAHDKLLCEFARRVPMFVLLRRTLQPLLYPPRTVR
jgi:hypothetical protein